MVGPGWVGLEAADCSRPLAGWSPRGRRPQPPAGRASWQGCQPSVAIPTPAVPSPPPRSRSFVPPPPLLHAPHSPLDPPCRPCHGKGSGAHQTPRQPASHTGMVWVVVGAVTQAKGNSSSSSTSSSEAARLRGREPEAEQALPRQQHAGAAEFRGGSGHTHGSSGGSAGSSGSGQQPQRRRWEQQQQRQWDGGSSSGGGGLPPW